MRKILYLSRGHGFGHAATDLEVIRALRRSGVDVEIASYGTGLAYYRERGVSCTNLRIDDVDDQGLNAAIRVMAFLRSRRDADLVVAHEIFTAPRMCAELGLRNVLLTHWFFSELGAPERDSLLARADHLVFLDFEHAHCVPPGFEHTVFAGAVGTPIALDRAESRTALGIRADERLVVVATGAVTAYNREHLEAVVGKAIRAWQRRGRQAGRLMVLSDLRLEGGDPAVEWVGRLIEPGPYFRGADVVIANATFSTMCTLARNEIPAVVVTGGRNPVDRLHADFFATAGQLTAIEVTTSERELWSAAAEVMAGQPPPTPLPWTKPSGIADLLRGYLV